MQLVKFLHKKDVRLLLKAFTNLKLSSIFQANNSSNIVVDGIDIPMQVYRNLAIISDLCLSPLEKVILEWGSAEINNSLVFIQFETNSTLVNNGRQLIQNKQTIIRSFYHLAEVFAILNYNVNSFSDGGKYNSIDLACMRIEELVKTGAEIIDLGVESTGYDAKALDFQTEINLLKDLLPEVLNLKQQYKFKLSIDTYHQETVNWLNNYAIDIINDVSGNLPLAQVKQITDNGQQYVLMHSLVVPSQCEIILPLDENPLQVIYLWLEQKLSVMEDYKIDISKVIFDCGIGFGKIDPQSWFLLNNLFKFNNFICEILLGHSRKSLFNHLKSSPPLERDLPTAVSAAALMKHVDYFRLHDLKLLNEIYPVLHQLKNYRL